MTAGLAAAVDQAIVTCGGDLRATIRALILANDYLENEVAELMKAVSHETFRLEATPPMFFFCSEQSIVS